MTDFIRREALLRNVKRLPVGKREALASRVRIWGYEATDFIRHEALLRNVKRLPYGKHEALASRVRI